MAGQEINFDDPSTWPQNDDIDGLAALAESSEDKPMDEGTEEATPAANDEPKAKEATPEETPKQDASDSLTEEGRAQEAPAAGSEEEAPDLSADKADGVYAKDGKHILPFKVVEELRRQNKELNAQLAQRQEQSTRTPQPSSAPEVAPEPEKTQDEDRDPLDLTDEDLNLTGEALQARLNQIEAEYGRAHRNLWQRTRENDLRLRELYQREQQAAQEAQEATREEVQAAIDRHPLLMAWQTDQENPQWYQRASRLHQDMIENEPDYQTLSLDEQMATLVEKIEALHGPSPHRAHIKPAEDTKPPAKDQPKAGTPKNPSPSGEKVGDLPVPTSLSSIPGGAPPDLGLAESFEKMSPQQIQAHFDKLAATNPSKFQEELSSL